jgi:transposase-like protein
MSNRKFELSEIKSKIELFHGFRRDGMKVHEITRRLGVSDTTIYIWLHKHDDANAGKSDMLRLKRENAKLRRQLSALRIAATSKATHATIL